MLTTGRSKAYGRDVVKVFDNYFSTPSTVGRKADYREVWVQARINELRGIRRMGYAEIARRAGVSKQYLHQVANGSPPSERLINGLVKAFDFEPPAPSGARAVVDTVKAPIDTVSAGDQPARSPDPWAIIAEMREQNRELMQLLRVALERNAVLESRNAGKGSGGRSKAGER